MHDMIFANVLSHDFVWPIFPSMVIPRNCDISTPSRSSSSVKAFHLHAWRNGRRFPLLLRDMVCVTDTLCGFGPSCVWYVSVGNVKTKRM